MMYLLKDVFILGNESNLHLALSFYDYFKKEVNAKPKKERLTFLDKIEVDMDAQMYGENNFDYSELSNHDLQFINNKAKYFEYNKLQLEALRKYVRSDIVTIKKMLEIHRKEIESRIEKGETRKEIFLDIGKDYGYTSYSAITNAWSDLENP